MMSNRSLSFLEGNAQSLPYFHDNTFDLYTIAFGLLNVTDVDAAIGEAFRVLKPGGRYMCLEFSKVDNAALGVMYDFYSFRIIPKVGTRATQKETQRLLCY
jgi:ubiquinone/menaquinone biosynthesis C-methylase UbiE